MPHSPRFHVQRVLFGLIATLSLANAALADDDQRAPRVPLLP